MPLLIKHRFLGGLIFSASMTLASAVGAYGPLDLNWKHNPKPMGENFEICLTGAPSGAAAAIKRAAKTWSYGKFTFAFKANGCSSSSTFPKNNGVNQIDFGSLKNANAGGAAKPYGTKPKMAECDIRFNSTLTWHTATTDPTQRTWDLESAALHELGHCLGLGDIPENPFGDNVVMEPLDVSEARRSLKTDDTEGREAIYGK